MSAAPNSCRSGSAASSDRIAFITSHLLETGREAGLERLLASGVSGRITPSAVRYA